MTLLPDLRRLSYVSIEMPGVPRQLQPLAVHVLPPVDIPGLPRLYSSEEARKCTRCGINKWTQVRRELDHVMIEGRWFCTAEALRAYIKKKTIKGVTPDGAARVTRKEGRPTRADD
jgi:hypothetical protein